MYIIVLDDDEFQYLVQRLSTAKNEVLSTDNKAVFEEVTASVVIECVLVTVECASVEGIEITCSSQCNCLLLHPTVGCWRGVLSSNLWYANQPKTYNLEALKQFKLEMERSVTIK